MIIISAQAFPPASGGKQTLMESLARAASAHHPVTVCADIVRSAKTKDLPTNLPYAVEWFSSPKILRQILKARRVTKLAKPHQASHIFCDSWRSAEHLPQDLNTPIFIYAHGNEYPLRPSPSKQKRIQRSLAKAAHIISVSSQTAARVEPFLSKADGAKLHIKPNPVSPPSPIHQADADYAEKLWPGGSTRLLVLCRLINWKGVDMAIKALPHLLTAQPNLHLVIAGTGPDADSLKCLVSSLDLNTHVTFAGRVEGGRKSALFESADLYLQPGRQIGDQCEGFGITYIEAGLHSLPSLSGKAGGAPDAVIHNRTGLVVDGENLNEIVIALQTLIDEPDRASHMGREAFRNAQSLLWENQIQPLLALSETRQADTLSSDDQGI